MAFSHLSHSYAQNTPDTTMQEHFKFVKQVLEKGPAFTTPEDQVAWDRLKDNLLGVHIHVVVSPEFFQCTHQCIGRPNLPFHIIVIT